MKWTFFLFLLVLNDTFCFSQKNDALRIRLNLCTKEVMFNESIPFRDSMVTIMALKFYITMVDEKDRSRIELIDWSDTTTHFLTNSTSCQLFLGTDSLTNVSGNIDGDLDPIHGMYWAWNSGYINFKLEGFWNNNPHQKFEYHIGGYRSPYSTIQRIGSPKNSNKEIGVDLDPIFNYIIDKNVPSIMTPGKNAMFFSQQLITCFRIQ